MKSNPFRITGIVFLLVLLNACEFKLTNLGSMPHVTGSGEVITKTRNVSGFSG